MKKGRIISALICIVFLVQGLNGQKREPGDTVELMNEIRRDKFEIFLPVVLRENKIDMWIHVIRPWATDPLAYEFGSNSAIFIFTDRGGDRIERAVFNYGEEVTDPGAYDVIGKEAADLDQQNFYVSEDPQKALETELSLRFQGLNAFVAKRDPQRIAVNYSEILSLAEGSEVRALTDGISHTDYLLLEKELGEKYTKRLVSAEYLILDYLSRRTQKEIEYHKQMGHIANKYLANEFAKIVPGKTKLEDLAQNVFVRDHDGNEHAGDDYVIQRGDLIGILYGAGDMRRIMDADVGGTGYVLKEGENELPPEVKRLWEESMKVRAILKKHIKAGPTAGETLKLLIQKLENAGFVYIDEDAYDKKADPRKTQVHLDLHAMGKGVLAPRISPMGPRWHWDLKIPLYHTFTFEYMVHTPVPKWGKGKHLYMCMHDGVMVTEKGVEFPYPPAQGIFIIR
jgi:hypothetical protein